MNDINIMGIDPSSTELGLSIFAFDTINYVVKDIITHPISISNLSEKTKDLDERLYIKTNVLETVLNRYIDFYQPSMVVIENNFFNMYRQSNIKPLTIIIHKIYEICKNRRIKVLTPSVTEIKKSLGLKNFNKKNTPEAIVKIYGLDLSDKNEHEIDAISICHYGVGYIINFKEYLFM
jgi:Holliday junction resolvasome RuvABC endonuclease subunit